MSNKLWLPAGYQGKSILGPDGKCMTCRDTGAIFHGLRLINPHCEDGRIRYVERVEQDWQPCSCYRGQRWQIFHPLNVRALLTFPGRPWHTVVMEELERVKTEIIRAAGGTYAPFQDTFLSDLGFDGTTGRTKDSGRN